MSTDAVNRIPEAIGKIADKVEEMVGKAVDDLEAAGNETIQKIGQATTSLKVPFSKANSILDELIGGHNGGPSLDDATFQNTVAGVAADASKSAATAAAPRPSALGQPTAGITASDIAK